MRQKLFTLSMLIVALAAPRAMAVKIADISRLDGERTNLMTGLGLVYGLKGTGDGGDFAAAINPLRAMLERFGDPVEAKELGNAQNVAVVMVTATIPASGGRRGDHLDVHVTSIGASPSLSGGRLFVTPMRASTPNGPADLALADGPIDIEDPSTPTTAVIKGGAGGAVLEFDVAMNVIDDGHFTLILDEPAASWTTASRIAKIINDSEATMEDSLASAIDSKSIIVTIPANEREHPDSFIGRVQQLPVQIINTEARVTINEKTGTIVMTGDVEISPVVISHNGLSISTIAPVPVPSPRAPVVTTHEAVAIATIGTQAGNLQDLVGAMEQLKVPAQDRIEIIKELHKTGKLHAKLIED